MRSGTILVSERSLIFVSHLSHYANNYDFGLLVDIENNHQA